MTGIVRWIGYSDMTVFMAVTMDKYELPIAVADTRKELANMLHVTPRTISCAIAHAKQKGWNCIYHKVEIDLDHD